MSEQILTLDKVYNSEHCNGSVFKAVVMMAQESRFINEQATQGYIELSMKPTTIAMKKFEAGRLSSTIEGEAIVESAEVETVSESEEIAEEVREA